MIGARYRRARHRSADSAATEDTEVPVGVEARPVAVEPLEANGVIANNLEVLELGLAVARLDEANRACMPVCG